MKKSRFQLLNPFYHLNRFNYHLEKNEYKRAIKHSMVYGLECGLYVAWLPLIGVGTIEQTLTSTSGSMLLALIYGAGRILWRKYDLGKRIFLAGMQINQEF